MKKLLTLIAFLFIIGGLVSLSSCTKDDDSAYQPKGNYGNTNIQYQNFTINSWAHFGTAGQPDEGYEVDANCYIITSNIISYGAVMAYLSDDNQSWFAMPVTIPSGVDASYPYSSSYNFFIAPGWLTVFAQDNDFYTTNPGTMYLKVVAISGAGRLANPDLDLRDYNAVKKAFDLKD